MACVYLRPLSFSVAKTIFLKIQKLFVSLDDTKVGKISNYKDKLSLLVKHDAWVNLYKNPYFAPGSLYFEPKYIF